MNMKSLGLMSAVSTLFIAPAVFSQSGTKDDVRFFNHYFNDAAVVTGKYLEGGAYYGDYDWVSAFQFGVQGGMPVGRDFDVGASWSIINWDPDYGDGESGLSDIGLWGRYRLEPIQIPANVTIGGMLTLPVGEEKVGQGNVNIGAFAAGRMAVGSGAVIMGSVGLNSIEYYDDRKMSLHLGGGAIFEFSPQTHGTAEFALDTKEDYFALTGGVDHMLSAGSRLRGAISVGLDDGAPDLALMGSYAIRF